jgi:hypothetical protein
MELQTNQSAPIVYLWETELNYTRQAKSNQFQVTGFENSLLIYIILCFYILLTECSMFDLLFDPEDGGST